MTAEAIGLSGELRRCAAQGRSPDTRAADVKLWLLALEELIQVGALDEAGVVTPHLAAAFPDSAILARLAMLLERMPPSVADATFAAFSDRKGEQVQVTRRKGADAVLFAFCGRFGSLGMPLPVIHRWFGPLGVHVAYLRDPAGEIFLDGIPALGSDRARTVDALRALAAELNATRIFCFGNSNGGYAALLYGLELRATAVLATNTLTIFREDWVDRRYNFPRARWAQTPDLAALYAATPSRPAAHLIFGADNAEDAASAARMEGISGVTVRAVAGVEAHDAHVALIERGAFDSLLQEFLAARPRSPSGRAR